MIGTHRGCLSTNNLNVVSWQQIGQTRFKRIKSENVGMRKISEFILSSILKLSANATSRRINSICPIKCCGRQLFDDEILLKISAVVVIQIGYYRMLNDCQVVTTNKL